MLVPGNCNNENCDNETVGLLFLYFLSKHILFLFFGLVTLININAEKTNKICFFFSLLLKILTTV